MTYCLVSDAENVVYEPFGFFVCLDFYGMSTHNWPYEPFGNIAV
jgi:hypothetical protein